MSKLHGGYSEDEARSKWRHPGEAAEVRRFRAPEHRKLQEAEIIRRRFASYSRSGGPGPRAKRLLLIVLTAAFVLAAAVSERFYANNHSTPFPRTGEARWYTDRHGKAGAQTAPLTITGLSNPGGNMVLRLDDWDTHTPIVLIPVRGGETAAVDVPLGRYRVLIAPATSWQGNAKLLGDVQEAVEPMEFTRAGTRLVGRRIDLTSRPDGNLKTRPASDTGQRLGLSPRRP